MLLTFLPTSGGGAPKGRRGRPPTGGLHLCKMQSGRADGIVTFNLRDFGPQAEQFGIAVLPPGEAVKRLEKRS